MGKQSRAAWQGKDDRLQSAHEQAEDVTFVRRVEVVERGAAIVLWKEVDRNGAGR